MANYIRGGGPFFCIDSPQLVETVLSKLGYLAYDNLSEAVDVFCELNCKLLDRTSAKRVERIGAEDQAPIKIKKLHDTFAAHGEVQQWKIPPSERNIRTHLVAKGLIKSDRAPRQEVLEAMHTYLRDVGCTEDLQPTYVGSVVQCAKFLNRRDPNLRERI